MVETTVLDNALKNNAEAYKDLENANAVFFEKIALYSGGIISVAVTFMGYVLSKNASVVLTTFLRIPIYIIAFAGGTLLFTSLILGIYVRVFFAKYRSIAASHNLGNLFAQQSREGLERIKNEGLPGFEKAVPQLIEQMEKLSEDNIERYKKREKQLKRSALVNSKVGLVILAIFVVGFFLILLFVSQVVLALAHLNFSSIPTP